MVGCSILIIIVIIKYGNDCGKCVSFLFVCLFVLSLTSVALVHDKRCLGSINEG